MHHVTFATPPSRYASSLHRPFLRNVLHAPSVPCGCNLLRNITFNASTKCNVAEVNKKKEDALVACTFAEKMHAHV